VFKGLKPIIYGGKEVWPLVEGGKGVSATNHASAGAWAAAGGIGTVSAVNADSYDANGDVILQTYEGHTRADRHRELIQYGIDGAVEQVERAFDIANGKGAININILWEMGGAEEILRGILERTKGMVTGVTCGAGMPYKLSEIAKEYDVYYLPIISSARAFRALWKRAYKKVPELLAAVVYEDPWLAGGHNGLSNAEDPRDPQDVWYLREWDDWIDNDELGKIAFQYGTRPLLTKESPIPDLWKNKLTSIEEGDVLLHKFSPTGFYSSAVKTKFLMDLDARSKRQIVFKTEQCEEFSHQLDVGVKGRNFWVKADDIGKAHQWAALGFDTALKTPDNSVVFVTSNDSTIIRKDQKDCMGCLSHCGFSSWKDHDNNSTGRLADPRSFCIQKSLQDIAHGGEPEDNLMFAGHAAYNFGTDPFYSNGFVPTVKQLVDRILTGD